MSEHDTSLTECTGDPLARQAMLPLALHDHIELVRSGAAVSAFAARRAEQMLRWGHTPESDLDRTIDDLVRAAADRLRSFTEITGRGLMELPPARRDMLIRKIEIAGALLIAAHERVFSQVPEQSE